MLGEFSRKFFISMDAESWSNRLRGTVCGQLRVPIRPQRFRGFLEMFANLGKLSLSAVRFDFSRIFECPPLLLGLPTTSPTSPLFDDSVLLWGFRVSEMVWHV